MTIRERLIAAIDPGFPRFESAEQLADRILELVPEPNTSSLAMLIDGSYRPLLTADELMNWSCAA